MQATVADHFYNSPFRAPEFTMGIFGVALYRKLEFSLPVDTIVLCPQLAYTHRSVTMNKIDEGIMAIIVLGLVILLPLIVVVNAVFLRAAVNFGNKLLGARRFPLPDNSMVAAVSLDESHLDRLNPYAMRGTTAAAESGDSLISPIPEPGLGNACGIVVASIFVSFTLQAPVELLARLVKVGPLPLQIISYVVGLFAMAGIYSAMLPASYRRAALVAIIHLLLVTIVGAFFTVLVMIVNGVAN